MGSYALRDQFKNQYYNYDNGIGQEKSTERMGQKQGTRMRDPLIYTLRHPIKFLNWKSWYM